jgi:hypothetical protein
MGSGAARLADDAELRARLAAAGWDVALERVAPAGADEPEIARTAELIRPRFTDR